MEIDSKDVQKLLEGKPDPVLVRIAESYQRIHRDRDELIGVLERQTDQYNELYGILIAVVRQHGNSLLVKKEHFPQFDVTQYKIRWEERPEEAALLLEVRHYAE